MANAFLATSTHGNPSTVPGSLVRCNLTDRACYYFLLIWNPIEMNGLPYMHGNAQKCMHSDASLWCEQTVIVRIYSTYPLNKYPRKYPREFEFYILLTVYKLAISRRTGRVGIQDPLHSILHNFQSTCLNFELRSAWTKHKNKQALFVVLNLRCVAC